MIIAFDHQIRRMKTTTTVPTTTTTTPKPTRTPKAKEATKKLGQNQTKDGFCSQCIPFDLRKMVGPWSQVIFLKY